MATKQYHYFVSTAIGWAKADSVEAAVSKLCKEYYTSLRPMLSNMQKAGQPGVPVFTCKVNAPASQNYEIKFFRPEGVELSEDVTRFITYMSKNHASTWSQS